MILSMALCEYEWQDAGSEFLYILCLSVCLSDCLFVCLSVCLYLSLSLSLFLSACLSVSLPFSLSVCLSLSQASMKVTVPEASIFVDVNSSVDKCLVLSQQGDGCRIEVQVRSLFILSFLMFSRLSSYLSVSS